MLTRSTSLLAVTFFLSAPQFLATPQELDTGAEFFVVPDGIGDSSKTPPPGFVERSSVGSIISMSPAWDAEASKLRSLRSWNKSGNLPARNGFSRDFSRPLNIVFPKQKSLRHSPVKYAGGFLSQSTSGDLLWGTNITVDDSYRLSLHLSDVRLPRGTRFWVYGTEDYDSVAFDLDQFIETEIWTPSVEGPTLHFEVQVPTNALEDKVYGFNIARILEIFDIGNRSNEPTNRNQTLSDCPVRACLRNADCYRNGILVDEDGSRLFTAVATEMKAIAHLRITAKLGQGSYVSRPCTGALINDKVQETIAPYLLTAEHCLYQKTYSIEAFFDDIMPCNGKALSLSSLPRATAKIVERVQKVDLALLKLDKLPTGRAFLGWYNFPTEIAWPEQSAFVHRLHHGCDLPMLFSWEWGSADRGKCPTSKASTYPNYLISSPYLTFYHNGDTIEDHPFGATWGGSSGAPLLGGARIYGTLYGPCPGVTLNCKDSGEEVLLNSFLGGALKHLRRYLDPANVPASPSNLQAKIIDKDRSVILTWRDHTLPPTDFLIEMRKDNGSFGDLARTKETSYIFTPTVQGTYFFRVLVESPYGNSLPSNIIVVKFRPH